MVDKLKGMGIEEGWRSIGQLIRLELEKNGVGRIEEDAEGKTRG